MITRNPRRIQELRIYLKQQRYAGQAAEIGKTPVLVITSSGLSAQHSAFTMANLVRSEKSGSSWGMNELIAFNIEVIDVNTQTFFGSALLPQLSLRGYPR
jgi:hypothetical protein